MITIIITFIATEFNPILSLSGKLQYSTSTN